MTQTKWWAYLSKLMGNETATEAAKKSGISSSNFTRWKKGANADPEFVVKIARAYNANVLDALVAAEFITEKEAASGGVGDGRFGESVKALEREAMTLESITRVVADTIQRIQSAYVKDQLGIELPYSLTFNQELHDKFDEAIRLSKDAEKDELAARRTRDGHVDPSDYDDGTVRDFDWDIPHAADSSPDENEERLKRGEDPVD